MSNYYLIINPMSGQKKGPSILKKIRGLFEEAGIDLEVDLSTHKNHPYELANTKNLDDLEAICIVGGDGTFHEVINGVLQRKDGKRLPIGFIPGGTGNSLMHDLDCLDPVKAVQKILSNKRGKMDIFEVVSETEKIFSFNILGWGMPSLINLRAEKLRALGGIRYDVASLIELMINKTTKVKIEIDDLSIEDDVALFLACNTKYTGNGMKMAPQAEFDDGLLDIFVVRKASRLRLLSLFLKVFKGKHIGDPVIEHYRAKSFSIESSTKDPLNIDGQNVGLTPIRAKILDEQLDVFI
ncbi:MAG: diacylglycerol kinase family lipid kinase [Saprospiraceae bacterium]|nr:diacylglycerol kinase family lipid kinase [Saprospiraceae bacterium]